MVRDIHKFNTKKKEIHAVYPDLPYTPDGGDEGEYLHQ